MRNLRLLGIVLTAVSLIAGSARAALIPAIHIPAMVDASELIVIGRANGTVSTPDNASETFLIQADRVLKGAGGLPQGPLVVRLDMVQPGYEFVSEGQYGIFFLHRLGPYQPYAAVDPYHPVVTASPARNSALPNPADPLSNVAQELARVFTTPGSLLIDPPTTTLVVAPPIEQMQWIYYYTASAMKSIPYETAGRPLLAIVGSSSILARLWAIDCLLFMGRSDDIEAVKLNVLQSVEPVLLNPTPDVALTVSMLGDDILGQITSPAAVPQLASLLSSSEATVRRAAAGNLSQIGSDAVIASLAKVALHDQSPDVRYFAVQGLAKATGARVWPTREAFNAGEAEMLHSWDEWAKTNVH